MIWLFDSEFEKPRYWLNNKQVIQNLGKKAWEGGEYRICFRDVAASTNERTLIVSILPKVWCGHSISVAQPYHPVKFPDGLNNLRNIWLSVLFGSLCIDYLVRQKVTNHISFYYLNTLPIPRAKEGYLDEYLQPVIARAARLICTSAQFADLWKSVFSPAWNQAEFWYPAAGNLDYGPAHEQQLRRQLAESASQLTPEWGPHCGVHDRLPDRRDTGDRAQLRAEIDACVAHLYGLGRDDFAYILDTFPVLKRKEEAAFGEFLSRRKCLEEYDRLITIHTPHPGPPPQGGRETCV